jgi:hypothetical protein
MAKKSRRVRRRPLSEAQLVQPTQTVDKEVRVAEKEQPEQADPQEGADFGREYHYVVRDLERIGILAAIMLGGLVVLSFIL